MTFDQEVHPRLRFDRDPLRVVVAQVRFPTSHHLATADAQAAIQAALAGSFPKPLAAIQEVTIGFTPQGPTTPQVAQSAIRFSDESEERIVSIGTEMASFETTRYAGWEAFRADLRATLELAARLGGIAEMSRFGLRYVDELAIEGVRTIADWSEVVAESLLGAPDGLARDPRVIKTAQRISLRIDDDIVNLRQGFTESPPGEDRQSVYLIDTDIFTTSQIPWDVDALMARADRYHTWVTNIFGRSLTPTGVERLGGRPR